MRIRLGEDGYVEGFAEVGDISNSIEVDFEASDEFEKYYSCYQHINGSLTVDEQKLAAKKQYDAEHDVEALLEEESILINNFSWYDGQVKQYERCCREGTEYDMDIDELDAQADIWQLRLREIRKILREQ